mmetsp:Transcript_9646/g.26695  ORF Transcript_9646/g.26695 Transcript_9646/m.26695 type:complete len:147 (+) Transcript_9646:1079-1519(+)
MVDEKPRIVVTYYPNPRSEITSCTWSEVSGKKVVQCDYLVSNLGLDTAELLTELLEAQGIQTVPDAIPVYVEAWGGNGGKGGKEQDTGGIPVHANGGFPGKGGYAMASFSSGDFIKMYPTSAGTVPTAPGPKMPMHIQDLGEHPAS